MGLERSVTVQYLLEKGMAKGIQKGVLEASREELLRVLKCRFGALDKPLKARISSLRDAKAIRGLIDPAVKASSLEEFSLELRERLERRSNR